MEKSRWKCNFPEGKPDPGPGQESLPKFPPWKGTIEVKTGSWHEAGFKCLKFSEKVESPSLGRSTSKRGSKQASNLSKSEKEK